VALFLYALGVEKNSARKRLFLACCLGDALHWELAHGLSGGPVCVEDSTSGGFALLVQKAECR